MRMYQEDYSQEKRYKTIPLKKRGVYYPNDNQTSLKEYQRTQNGEFDDIYIEIYHILYSEDANKIEKGTKALINLLATNKQSDLQKIAHQFIPRLLKLIKRDYTFKYKLVVCLARVTSFGKLSEQCLQIFKYEGLQIICEMVQSSKTKYLEIGCILVSNLSIESVMFRDLFIQKGVVETIVEAYKQHLMNYQKKFHSVDKLYGIWQQEQLQEKERFKQNAFFALIALSFGDPLPSRRRVKKAMIMVLANIEIGDFPVEVRSAAMWVLYHYYDYRDEKQCSYLLKELLKYVQFRGFRFPRAQGRIRQAEANFNKIFLQIYEYHSPHSDNNIMHLLHGFCYRGALQKYDESDFSDIIIRQYTPKMYLQLFRAAPRHKMNTIKNALIRIFESAFLVIKVEGQENVLLALEFISWVMTPLQKREEYEFNTNQYRQLSYREKHVLMNNILPIIESNLSVLYELGHHNSRTMAETSFKIIYKYNELITVSYYNQVCIEK